MITVAVQYPSFGPQHPPRLAAIAKACPYSEARIVAMEMFRKDSDYEWDPVSDARAAYQRYTVSPGESAVERRSGGRLRAAVYRALDTIRPNVLVVNGWGHRESRHSLRWAAKHRCRTVLLSDSSYEDAPRVWHREAYKRWLVRRCRAAFVAGSPQARYAVKLGIPAQHVFHPGSCVVDNEYWARESQKARQLGTALRRKLGLPERYFLFVGRLIAKKNALTLVRAYAEYRQRSGPHDFGLVLCGSGPQARGVVETCQGLGLDDVLIAGLQQVGQLPKYYGLASCFVMPSSHYEQWGLVANEAMAAGLPVLLSRKCGCVEDLVREGVNGYTFDPSNVSQLAERMTMISQDASKLAEMGAQAKALVAEHSCDTGADNFWRAIKSALPHSM